MSGTDALSRERSADFALIFGRKVEGKYLAADGLHPPDARDI